MKCDSVLTWESEQQTSFVMQLIIGLHSLSVASLNMLQGRQDHSNTDPFCNYFIGLSAVLLKIRPIM